MTVKKTYYCNLCGENLYTDSVCIGIKWSGGKMSEVPASGVENHLCAKCVSGIQNDIPVYCGGGQRGCSGGPSCGSSHK